MTKEHLGCEIESKPIAIKWLGAAGLEITYDGETILIDPYLTRPDKKELLLQKPTSNSEIIRNYLDQLTGKLSTIVVSHTHIDHALDVPSFAQQAKGNTPHIIGSSSLDNLFKRHKMPGYVEVPHVGQSIPLRGDIMLKLIPSQHGMVAGIPHLIAGEIKSEGSVPLRTNEYKDGDVFISKISLGEKTLMHMGSASFLPEAMKDEKCDILFLCVPGWRHNRACTHELLETLQPSKVVLFHFDDFSAPSPEVKIPFVGLQQIQKEIQKNYPQAEIIIPKAGETMTF